MNHRTEYGFEPLTIVPLMAISDLDLLIGTNGQSSPLDCLKSSHCLVFVALGEQFEESLESSRRSLGPVMEEEPWRARPFLGLYSTDMCKAIM